jgi:hypothetical protein
LERLFTLHGCSAPTIFLARKRFCTDYPPTTKEVLMTLTRSFNLFLVCAAFAFVASVVLGIVP